MRALTLHLGWWVTRAYLAVLAQRPTPRATPRPRDDRGDVPGWVLITVMSAGIVSALGLFATDALTDLLRSALNSVK